MALTNLNGEQTQKQNALLLAIEVLKASPGILPTGVNGDVVTRNLAALADGILEYITKTS